MVMPKASPAWSLPRNFHDIRPHLKIVFASGYSMDEMDSSFLHKGHATFLQKPYTHVTLAKAVRAALDQQKA